jgi:hypothetical protein
MGDFLQNKKLGKRRMDYGRKIATEEESHLGNSQKGVRGEGV